MNVLKKNLKGFLEFIADNTVTDVFSKRNKESVEKAKEDIRKNYRCNKRKLGIFQALFKSHMYQD